LSEYFDFTRWPDKADRKVTRVELLALMTQKYKAEQASRWWRRLWRWLRWMGRPAGSGRIPPVPPTEGEIERGEDKPVARRTDG
jgi:site-specific recombinase